MGKLSQSDVKEDGVTINSTWTRGLFNFVYVWYQYLLLKVNLDAGDRRSIPPLFSGSLQSRVCIHD